MFAKKLTIDAVYGGLAAATLALFAQPALAEPQGVTVQSTRDGIRTARVSHTDLNLSSEAGRKALDRRVQYAVRAVCPALHGRSLKETYECQRRAATDARPQVLAALERNSSIQLAAAGE